MLGRSTVATIDSIVVVISSPPCRRRSSKPARSPGVLGHLRRTGDGRWSGPGVASGYVAGGRSEPDRALPAVQADRERSGGTVGEVGLLGESAVGADCGAVGCEAEHVGADRPCDVNAGVVETPPMIASPVLFISVMVIGRRYVPTSSPATSNSNVEPRGSHRRSTRIRRRSRQAQRRRAGTPGTNRNRRAHRQRHGRYRWLRFGRSGHWCCSER